MTPSATPENYTTLTDVTRYRRLSAIGKKLPVVVPAIAREMAAFLWAIGREVAPA
jgi:transposase